ncbi:MAG TPA: class I SAM-dependent DNA methyltransferase [Candidatus Angelobacter sp.]|nr:class I SAM-dependent DNA methyltransferase [Candidatus Angelobacter sp.]
MDTSRRDDLREHIEQFVRLVESQFPPLDGVFSRGLIADVEHWSSDYLYHVVSQLSALSLGITDEDRLPIFGHWFDTRLAMKLNPTRSAGEYGTPEPLALLMIALANLHGANEVLDPCCGIGTLLSHAAAEARQVRNHVELFGQEINVKSWALATLRLFLLGHSTSHLALGDTLRKPAFSVNDKLKKFDRVLCDTPLGLQLHGAEASYALWWDTWDRNSSRISGESAFLRFVISSLKEEGRAIVAVSQSLLFRSGDEARLRERLLSMNFLRAVVGLPGKLRHGSSIETALLVLERIHSGKVLFVNATNLRNESRTYALSSSDIEHLYNLIDLDKEEKGISKLISYSSLRGHNASFVPKHYVSLPDPHRESPDALRSKLKELESEHEDVVRQMNQLLDIMQKKAD